MGPLPLDLEQLQEHLGELLVELLLDAQNSSAGYDPSPIMVGFGCLFEAMTHLEFATLRRPGTHARSADALGETAFQLLNDLAERLTQINLDRSIPLAKLQRGVADWVVCHGGKDRNLELRVAQLRRVAADFPGADFPAAGFPIEQFDGTRLGITTHTGHTQASPASNKPTLH